MVELLHLSLWVSDVDRAVEFYCDGLGYEVDRSAVRRGNEENVSIADDAGRELQLKRSPDHEVVASRSGFDHLAVAVDDLDGAIERLEARGGELIQEPRSGSSGDFRFAFIADPDGHAVELMEGR